MLELLLGQHTCFRIYTKEQNHAIIFRALLPLICNNFVQHNCCSRSNQHALWMMIRLHFRNDPFVHMQFTSLYTIARVYMMHDVDAGANKSIEQMGDEPFWRCGVVVSLCGIFVSLSLSLSLALDVCNIMCIYVPFACPVPLSRLQNTPIRWLRCRHDTHCVRQ